MDGIAGGTENRVRIGLIRVEGRARGLPAPPMASDSLRLAAAVLAVSSLSLFEANSDEQSHRILRWGVGVR